MSQANRILSIFSILLIVGCKSSFSGQVTGLYVGLDTIKDSQMFEESLTEEQIKESIIEGAVTAGWKPEDLGDNMILATYRIRKHTVQVIISYSDFSYKVRYKSSIGMKMYCFKRDRDKKRNQKLSGLENCPYDQAPQYIHRNYDTWISSLISEIENSRASRL